MIGFGTLDYLALAGFLACWYGYLRLADGARLGPSVPSLMGRHRKHWMSNLVRREPRMIDTLIHSNLQNGVAFFASTSILLVGGLLAILGAADKALAVLRELPLTPTPDRTTWELKVLLLVVIFVYAFFKFAWAYRLFNYCAILIGAAPMPEEYDQRAEDFAARMAKLQDLAAMHFNNGLRAYFYALGALGWFVHPLLFMLTTVWVTWVLYRREFRSRSHALLQEALEVRKPT
ncbi:MAG: DUF599 family protein [Candidatus Competibacterales bacterium]|nr:DUF599 family protein [Candidatus Competibacterales bacterium]